MDCTRRALAAVIMVTLAAETRAKEPDPVVKIVSSLPRKGGPKAQTDSIVNGIKLALEEAGWKAGKFKVVFDDLDDATEEDGRWSPDREQANAESAVADKDVIAYIGPYNSWAARVSMPILNKARLLMVSPGCTDPALTKKGLGDANEPQVYRPSKTVNFVRVVPTDEIQGGHAAEFADSLKLKTAVVIDDNERYGTMLAAEFKARWERLGLRVLGKPVSIDDRMDDFLDVLKRVREANPDVIYFGGTSQTGGPKLVRDMAAVGLKCPLIVPDACYEPAFLTAATADALTKVKCYVTAGGVDPSLYTGPGKKFASAYKERHKTDPESLAVYGYDAANVVLAAIAKAGKVDRQAITEAALGIKDFRSPQGAFSFDKNGDTSLQATCVLEATAKDFKFLKVLPAK
jgi:branched-chain amino acid transport system substrate-binding protein